MTPWKTKAHQIIAELCRESYRQVNIMPNGKRRVKHVPYNVPEDAAMLIGCLDRDDEVTAKDYFIRRATFGDSFREVA